MNQEECVCRDENEVCDDGTDCMIVGGDDTISHVDVRMVSVKSSDGNKISYVN